MHDVFSSVKSLLKVDTVTIDNSVFKLHYQATLFFLLAFSALVTQKQYFGDPIDCLTSDDVDSEIMDIYCWIHGTYVITEHFHDDLNIHKGKKIMPGVGPASRVGPDSVPKEHKYHLYYQWVTLFLFLQAAMFYIPKYIWKIQEGEKMERLVQDLDAPIVDEKEKDEKKVTLTDYFKGNLHKHEFYAFKYFGCEILNFANVVGQIFFVDRFLGNEFTTYGTRVLEFTKEEGQMNRTDPMYMMFPRVTKCHMRSYGSSGTLQTHDSLCVLPVNIINEKIFIFLWFWFIILATISGVALIYHMLWFLPQFRKQVIAFRAKVADAKELNDITRKCKIGDWFVLYQLSKNLDPIIYKEFISELADKLIDAPFIN